MFLFVFIFKQAVNTVISSQICYLLEIYIYRNLPCESWILRISENKYDFLRIIQKEKWIKFYDSENLVHSISEISSSSVKLILLFILFFHEFLLYRVTSITHEPWGLISLLSENQQFQRYLSLYTFWKIVNIIWWLFWLTSINSMEYMKNHDYAVWMLEKKVILGSWMFSFIFNFWCLFLKISLKLVNVV